MTMSGNDFRLYAGVDFSSDFLAHYGVGHDKGGHSGRYPWGSGDRPKQRDGSSTPAKSDATYQRDSKRVKKILSKCPREQDEYTYDGTKFTRYKMSKKQYDEIVNAISNHIDPTAAANYRALEELESQLSDKAYAMEQEWINNNPELGKLAREWTGDGTEFYWQAQEMVPNKELDEIGDRDLFMLGMIDEYLPKADVKDVTSLTGIKDVDQFDVEGYGSPTMGIVERDALYIAGKNLKDTDLSEHMRYMDKEIDKHLEELEKLRWSWDYYSWHRKDELSKTLRGK